MYASQGLDWPEPLTHSPEPDFSHHCPPDYEGVISQSSRIRRAFQTGGYAAFFSIWVSCSVLHSRVPTNEGLPELVIEYLRPDLE